MRHQQARLIVITTLLGVLLGVHLPIAHCIDRSEHAQQTLFPTGQQILGSEGSASVMLALPLGLSASEPAVLQLSVDVAPEVMPDKSTISLELDEVPFHSTFLSTATRAAPLKVNLPQTTPGFHLLRIRTRLVSALDPCLSTRRERLWIKLRKEGVLTYVQQRADAIPLSVAELLTQWHDTHAAVSVVTPAQIPREQLPLYLAADSFLRSLLARPRTAGTSSPTLILRTDQAVPEDSPLPTAQLTAQQQSLTIASHSPHALLTALSALRQPERWQQCLAPSCDLIWPITASKKEADQQTPDLRTPDRNRPRSLVRSLRDLGFSQGYVVQGEGQHTVTLSWPRPSFYRIKEWPTLRLLVHRSLHPALHPQKSAIEVRLHGRLLAKFSLDHAGPPHKPLLLTVDIPAAYFSLDSLSFEVVTSLIGSAAPPRCVLEPSALWIVIAADSGLYVPREEITYPRSLAGFAERAAEKPPRLVLPPALSAASLPQLGAVLFALDHGQRWDLAASVADCGAVCIDAQIAKPGSQLPHATTHGTELEIHAAQDEKTRHMRLLIFLTEKDHGQAELVHPDLSAIITSHAAFSQGRWQPQGNSGKTGRDRVVLTPKQPVFDAIPIDSDQQRERKLWDGLWMSLVLDMMLIGWLFVRFGRRSTVRGVSP